MLILDLLSAGSDGGGGGINISSCFEDLIIFARIFDKASALFEGDESDFVLDEFVSTVVLLIDFELVGLDNEDGTVLPIVEERTTLLVEALLLLSSLNVDDDFGLEVDD